IVLRLGHRRLRELRVAATARGLPERRGARIGEGELELALLLIVRLPHRVQLLFERHDLLHDAEAQLPDALLGGLLLPEVLLPRTREIGLRDAYLLGPRHARVRELPLSTRDGLRVTRATASGRRRLWLLRLLGLRQELRHGADGGPDDRHR